MWKLTSNYNYRFRVRALLKKLLLFYTCLYFVRATLTNHENIRSRCVCVLQKQSPLVIYIHTPVAPLLASLEIKAVPSFGSEQTRRSIVSGSPWEEFFSHIPAVIKRTVQRRRPLTL